MNRGKFSLRFEFSICKIIKRSKNDKLLPNRVFLLIVTPVL